MNTPRPSWSNYFMGIAKAVSARASCPRLSVGTVIVDLENHIVGSGYNGAPPGVKECEHPCTCGHAHSGYPALFHLPDCESKQPCTTAIHSEQNAIRHSPPIVQNFTLYTTHSPCSDCAYFIASAEITRVVYETEYRKIEPLTFLRERGILVEKLEMSK